MKISNMITEEEKEELEKIHIEKTREKILRLCEQAKKHLYTPLKGRDNEYYLPVAEKAVLHVALKMFRKKMFEGADIKELWKVVRNRMNVDKHFYKKYVWPDAVESPEVMAEKIERLKKEKEDANAYISVLKEQVRLPAGELKDYE